MSRDEPGESSTRATHTPEPETAAPPPPAAHDTADPPPTAPATSRRTASTSSRPPTGTAARASCSGCGCRRTSNYLYFVLGGVLVLLGLSIWEALAITVIGNLWWAAVGWLAVSGPASGTPSVAIMRAMFGVRGNRVFGGGLGVAIGLFYEIINIAVATLAAIALLGILGVAAAGRRRVDRARRGRRAQLRAQRLRPRHHPEARARVLGRARRGVRRARRVRARRRRLLVRAGPDAGRRPLGDAAARLRDRRLGPAVVGHRRRLRPLPAAGHVEARGRLVDRARRLRPRRAHRHARRRRRHRDRHDRPAAHHRRDRARVVHADLPRDRRARQHHEQRARRVLHRPLRAGARHPGARASPRS